MRGITFSRLLTIFAIIMVIMILVASGVMFMLIPPTLRFIAITENISTYPIVFILISALLIVVASILPKRYLRWKINLINVFYIFLFVSIALLELAVISPYMKKKEIRIEECKGFFPTEETRKGFFWNTVGAMSCIFAGYYPYEYTPYGLTIFLIFYWLLPFIFISFFVYGLFRGMKMEEWFGGGDLGRNIVGVFSIVLSLIAARFVLTYLLIEFFAYGMIGLFGVSIPIVIIGGLKLMIDKWLIPERFALEIIEKEKKIEKDIHTYVFALRERLLGKRTPLGRLKETSEITRYDEFNTLRGILGEKNPRILDIIAQATEAKRIFDEKMAKKEKVSKADLRPYHEIIKTLDLIERENK